MAVFGILIIVLFYTFATRVEFNVIISIGCFNIMFGISTLIALKIVDRKDDTVLFNFHQSFCSNVKNLINGDFSLCNLDISSKLIILIQSLEVVKKMIYYECFDQMATKNSKKQKNA